MTETKIEFDYYQFETVIRLAYAMAKDINDHKSRLLIELIEKLYPEIKQQ